MRKALAVMLAAVVVALGACGGDDDKSARTVDPPTTTEGADETTTTKSTGTADLSTIVVRLEDLPTGYTTSPPEEDDDESDCAGDDPTDELEPADRAESTFQQSDFGPFIGSVAGRFGSSDEASSVIDAFAEALAACDGYVQVDDDGNETTYSVTPLSFPGLGDDTFAARISGTTAFGPINVDFVIAQQDDIVLYLSNGGIGAADTDLTEALVRKMVDRAR